MKKTVISVSIALNVVLISFYVLLKLTSPQPSNLHIQNLNEQPSGYLTLKDCFQGLDSTNIIEGFNYQSFLQENAFVEPFDLDGQLNDCDTSVIVQDTVVEYLVFNALSNKAFELCKDSLDLAHTDFLFRKLKWAEKLQNAAIMSDRHTLLFSRIADFWFQKILSQVQTELQKDDNLKYSFDYQFITTRLGENKYFSGVKNSDTEKVFQNLSEGKYFYLWTRLTQKSLSFQIVIFTVSAFCIVVFAIGLISMYKSVKGKIKN